MQKSLLVIFARTPEYGKVKKRLAMRLGAEKALEIHNKLLSHTLTIAEETGIAYKIYLSTDPDKLQPYDYELQAGNDLGQRMHHALHTELTTNTHVCLIGSDCLEISQSVITRAFEKLAAFDVVIGPAVDGGYYLIGLTKANAELFSNINWGSSTVLANTLKRCMNMNLSVHQLEFLNDIDRPEDVPYSWLLDH